ncbi:MAG: TraB/GumN family protein [Minisyncoccales bacterium]
MLENIDNIYLLGTAHVSKQSQKDIISQIELLKPEVVAIELDLGRLRALLEENKDKKKKKKSLPIKELGLGGYIFAKVGGYVQSKIAKKLGVESGIDMKTAFLEARKHKIPTALIDQNIQITLKNFSKIPFTKKFKIFSNLIFKSFNKKYKKELNIDISKGIPNSKELEKILAIIQREAPELYQVLIHNRNVYMVEKLLKLREKHQGPILAVLGAGHVPGMFELLKQEINNPNKVEFSFTIEN